MAEKRRDNQDKNKRMEGEWKMEGKMSEHPHRYNVDGRIDRVEPTAFLNVEICNVQNKDS